jgi:hypothetical protein
MRPEHVDLSFEYYLELIEMNLGIKDTRTLYYQRLKDVVKQPKIQVRHMQQVSVFRYDLQRYLMTHSNGGRTWSEYAWMLQDDKFHSVYQHMVCCVKQGNDAYQMVLLTRIPEEASCEICHQSMQD